MRLPNIKVVRDSDNSTWNLVDFVFPVGSYYTTSKNEKPAELWGGKWELKYAIGKEATMSYTADTFELSALAEDKIEFYVWERVADNS